MKFLNLAFLAICIVCTVFSCDIFWREISVFGAFTVSPEGEPVGVFTSAYSPRIYILPALSIIATIFSLFVTIKRFRKK